MRCRELLWGRSGEGWCEETGDLNSVIMSLCTQVWLHCQTSFHRHHLVYNGSSAHLMRHTGLTRKASEAGEVARRTDKPSWLTEGCLSGGPVLCDEGWHIWCAQRGKTWILWASETRHHDERQSELLMMLSVGGRGQWSCGAEVHAFCMTAWCKLCSQISPGKRFRLLNSGSERLKAPVKDSNAVGKMAFEGQRVSTEPKYTKKKIILVRLSEENWISLTGSVGANVNDFTLCAVDLVLVRRRELGLHHDGVLRPGFQRKDEIARFNFSFVRFRRSMWRFHICYYPAIGAAGILPVKFGYILEGSFEGIKKK